MIDKDKIEATLGKGISKLILPKIKEEKKEKKKIEVKYIFFFLDFSKPYLIKFYVIYSYNL